MEARTKLSSMTLKLNNLQTTINNLTSENKQNLDRIEILEKVRKKLLY